MGKIFFAELKNLIYHPIRFFLAAPSLATRRTEEVGATVEVVKNIRLPPPVKSNLTTKAQAPRNEPSSIS